MRLKLYVLCCICLCGLQNAHSEGGTWIWMKGSDSVNAPANFGTLGVAARSNNPLGQYEALNWIDKQGNFWIFGGVAFFATGNFGVTNDLWKYSPATNNWTWMGGPGGATFDLGNYGIQGMPSPANWPPARGWGSVSWTDNNGNLWCFGGLGPYNAVLNDLWMYNTSTNEWTWIDGDNTLGNIPADVYGALQQYSDFATPGGRQECATAWIDDQNTLWFFGGDDESYNPYNDVWRYNISTNQWAWMSGPQGTNQPGNYGTFGVESPANVPPPRGTYTRWKDADGSFYIWGGISNFFNDGGQVLSDVWKYNTRTNYWTWVGGDSTLNSTGNYGFHCVDNGHTGPMARGENRTSQVLGCSNAFLTFGGFYPLPNVVQPPVLNDMWLFNTQTYEWRWVSGTDKYNDIGNYGQQGVASPANQPPARFGGCLWTDAQGSLWMFSGQDSLNANFNDVWKFIPDQACLGVSLLGGIDYTLTPGNLCLGDSAILTIDSTVGSVQVSPLNQATMIDAHHYILYPNASANYLITGNSTCSGHDSANVSISVNKPGHFTYAVSDTQLCTGNQASLKVSGALNVQVSPFNNFLWVDSAHAVISPDSSTTYTLVAQVSCAANDTVAINLNVIPPPQPVVTGDTDLICPSDTAHLCSTGGFAFYQWSSGESSACIATQTAGNYQVTVTDQNRCTGTSNNFILNVQIPGSYFSQLETPLICIGDTGRILVADTNVTVSPTGSITWTGQFDGFLNPDTTTTFVLIAQVLCAVDTAQYTLQVNNPVVNITANSNLICSGDSVVICATPGFSTYSWNNAGDSSCFSTGAGTYSVSVTDANNCTAQSIPLTIGLLTPGQFGYAVSDSVVCPGSSVKLGVVGNAAILLSPDSIFTVVDSTHFLLTPVSNATYTLIAQIACRPADTVIIPVQVLPAPVVNISADTTIICQSDSVLLCAAQNFNSYSWSNGSTSNCTFVHLAGTYFVTVTDQNNCSGVSAPVSITYGIPTPFLHQLSDSAICYGKTAMLSYSGATNVQVFPVTAVTPVDSGHAILHPDSTTIFTLIAANDCFGNDTVSFTLPVYHPQVAVVADTSIICANDSAQICATTGFESYLWNNGASTACIYASESGNYYLTVTDEHNCAAVSNHVAVEIMPNPSISIGINRDTFEVYGDTAVQWYLNGVAITGATGQVYIASQAGSYSVQVRGSDGCTTVSNIFYYTTDISDIEPDAVDIYPNPLASGTWKLEVSMGFIGQTMQIFDDNGRIVYSAGIHSLHTEISPGFASGIYYLRINSPNNMIVRKIIKL